MSKYMSRVDMIRAESSKIIDTMEKDETISKDAAEKARTLIAEGIFDHIPSFKEAATAAAMLVTMEESGILGV